MWGVCLSVFYRGAVWTGGGVLWERLWITQRWKHLVCGFFLFSVQWKIIHEAKPRNWPLGLNDQPNSACLFICSTRLVVYWKCIFVYMKRPVEMAVVSPQSTHAQLIKTNGTYLSGVVFQHDNMTQPVILIRFVRSADWFSDSTLTKNFSANDTISNKAYTLTVYYNRSAKLLLTQYRPVWATYVRLKQALLFIPRHQRAVNCC